MNTFFRIVTIFCLFVSSLHTRGDEKADSLYLKAIDEGIYTGDLMKTFPDFG